MFESTYQSDPQSITHLDIAEQYRRSLMAYRRATGQDLDAGRTISYFKQNSRGLFWIAAATFATAAALVLFGKSKRGD